ncbi:MAG: 50S ribosomal protein L23 [Anaerolineae bacterium]|jgi:large subunit ribosomal protein L23|nr:50S ribosomal protein L23 [Anaerolineae bacterium]
MDIYDVIIRPITTEKSELRKELGQYTFEVNRRANKQQIQDAVSEIYAVTVVSVNVMNMPAKIRHARGRRVNVHLPAWKKAIVTVASGQRIDALEA